MGFRSSHYILRESVRVFKNSKKKKIIIFGLNENKLTYPWAKNKEETYQLIL